MKKTLKEWRLSRKIKQETFADMLKIPQERLSGLERGVIKLSQEEQNRIAQILNIDPNEIVLLQKENSIFGERLELLRAIEGHSYRELGKLTNVSPTYLSNIENGTSPPSDNIKISLARLYNVSLDFLMGEPRRPYPDLSALEKQMEKTRQDSPWKEFRKKQKMTQQEMADMLQLPRTTYAYYENGKIKIPDEIKKRFEEIKAKKEV